MIADWLWGFGTGVAAVLLSALLTFLAARPRRQRPAPLERVPLNPVPPRGGTGTAGTRLRLPGGGWFRLPN